VAGATDVIGHLEAILNGTRRVAVGDAMRDRAEARTRQCDVPQLARQAFASVERELPDARLVLRRGTLPWVDGDPDLLRTLFLDGVLRGRALERAAQRAAARSSGCA
jgi:hypothetical protein